MISTDFVLLGALVIGFLAFIPLGVGFGGLFIWLTRPKGRGRREAS